MNEILTPDQIADLAGISQICEELGADLVVIGATSLLILMGDLGRFTRDVDLTVALDFDEFERLTMRLSLHSSSRRRAWYSRVARIARSRMPLTDFSGGAASNLRVWWSASAGVLPSSVSLRGRFTPLTGLCVTAFLSQRY